MCVDVFDRVHFAAAYIFASNNPRLVLEGDAVVVALGDQVGILFAGSVEEVELLAPVALALRLCAIVASGFGLVALEMALSAGQAAGAGALWLAIGGCIAVSFLGRGGPPR